MPGNKTLLRPPHSPDEDTFLDLCIRCQACVNICPTNALQPLQMQAGLYGLWSPAFNLSIGGCKVDCSSCSKVCPTQAIGRFDLTTKYHLKIGTARVLRSKCLSWVEGKPCGKCIPECPTGAIGYLQQGDLQLPSEVDFLLCVGCGICQHICNEQTFGAQAIVVTSNGRNTPSGVPGDIIKTYLEKL